MLRGLYTAAAGMLSQQKRTEMLSNNIANVNTPGYKADQSAIRAFPEMLLSRMEGKDAPTSMKMGTQTPIGALNTGAYLQELVPQFTQGDLKETGLPTDVALLEEEVPANAETGMKGFLLFAVGMQDGTLRYTRNGHFTVNGQNQLTSNGMPVLSTDGAPIEITGEDFEITPDGRVRINGQETAQIDVRFAGDVRNLIKESSGFFRTEDGVPPLASAAGNPDVRYSLKQGFTESSNVDTARAYTEMMTAYRSFEANQKVLQAYDRSLEKAVNEIGRLN
ncbi:flagellar hook-basal body complex protein [Bacillus mangrovi]|uniref:Flagellar hook-basal body complex protein n=1 Tax=Metabacillus mangrovi TaxID=1491830 RepID=A0A7X2S5D8_9BACI|nr:flagellar hook-basal body protein [Metabacillus mangrovi]MTH53979.1 flagellar hook-basal body complex protein [Metabacillus mangrovi]